MASTLFTEKRQSIFCPSVRAPLYSNVTLPVLSDGSSMPYSVLTTVPSTLKSHLTSNVLMAPASPEVISRDAAMSATQSLVASQPLFHATLPALVQAGTCSQMSPAEIEEAVPKVAPHFAASLTVAMDRSNVTVPPLS